jgi:hypothetical protein
MAFLLLSGRSTQHHPLVDKNSISDFRCLPDNNTSAVVDEKPATNGGSGMYLDAGQEAAKVREESCWQAKLSLP